MNESDFQALYQDYTSSKPESAERNRLIDKLHLYVYRYAMRRFNENQDVASDFYMKMYDRIPRFYEEYDPGRGIPFMFYVAVILKTHYIKYYMARAGKRADEPSYIDWSEAISSEKKVYSQNDTSVKYIQIKDILLESMAQLSINTHIALRLYFGFFLLLNHFRELLKRHGSLVFFALYRKYLEKLHKFSWEEAQEKNKLLEKAYTAHQKTNSAKDEQEISKQKAKHYKIIEMLYKVKSPISLRMVSKFMKLSISQVHRLLGQGKSDLKKILLEKYEKVFRF